MPTREKLKRETLGTFCWYVLGSEISSTLQYRNGVSYFMLKSENRV